MKLSAVRLFVDDLAAAKVFYSEVIGLHLANDGAQHGFFSVQSNGINIIVETVGSDAPPEDKALVGRFLGLSFAVEDIHGEYRRMSAQGVKFTGAPEQQSWGGWLATFQDPAGNELQIAQYR